MSADSIIIAPSQELIDAVKKEREYPGDEEKQFCLTHIKDWLKSTPYLPHKLDDDYIYRYLFGCKFNLQETKNKLESYLVLRAQYPQLYTDLKTKQLANSGVALSVLPNTTSDGCRVYCIYDHTETHDLTIVLKNFLMLTQYVAHHDVHPASGFVIMLKSEIMSVKKYFQWTPQLLKFAIENIKTTPESMKGFFILDYPDYVKPIMDLIKKFASQKISERIYFNEPEKLFELIPREMVPHEFGGDGKSAIKMADQILHVFEEEESWFSEHEKLQANLELFNSLHKEKSQVDAFGVQGSFRKLTVD